MSARRLLDFGFDPAASPHHFVVAPQPGGAVLIAETHGWGEDATEEAGEPQPPRPKALLDAYRWGRVSERAAEEFNRRLRGAGGRAARWKKGDTLLAPHFGKELTLLAWAIEGADPTLIPAMLANWSGLAPEERWWLYTTINATFVRPEEEPRGWRKAIKIAFAENPVEALPSALLAAPSVTAARRGGGSKRHKAAATTDSQITMELPGIAEDALAYEYDPEPRDAADERDEEQGEGQEQP